MTAAPIPVVLVVEDDEDVRETILESLEEEGYVAVGARDGEEAIRFLGEMPTMPALILLDMMMPNMNGFQFREAQLACPAWSAIPVVVLTADGTVDSKATQLGAAGILRKPVKLATLLGTVARTCGEAKGES